MENHVCKKFCSFYKPNKTRLKCGTYNFLQRNLSPGELRRIASRAPAGFDLSKDRQIKQLVCEKCNFKFDGCDFRDGLDSQPCGGYPIIERLLKGYTMLVNPQK
jgi:hypothetical protein